MLMEFSTSTVIVATPDESVRVLSPLRKKLIAASGMGRPDLSRTSIRSCLGMEVCPCIDRGSSIVTISIGTARSIRRISQVRSGIDDE